MLAFILGYLLGSLPFGVWVARLHGVCIFEAGSGCSGATNVLRTLGKQAGYTVFALDVLKGMLTVLIGLWLQCPYWSLFGALLGHSYSCFACFKGGKGIATLIGGLFCIMPLPVVSGLIVWWIVFKLLHYVSCASICFVLSLLPFYCLYYGTKSARLHALPLFFLVLLILFHHRFNLIRLWQGRENRF